MPIRSGQEPAARNPRTPAPSTPGEDVGSPTGVGPLPTREHRGEHQVSRPDTDDTPDPRWNAGSRLDRRKSRIASSVSYAFLVSCNVSGMSIPASPRPTMTHAPNWWQLRFGLGDLGCRTCLRFQECVGGASAARGGRFVTRATTRRPFGDAYSYWSASMMLVFEARRAGAMAAATPATAARSSRVTISG